MANFDPSQIGSALSGYMQQQAMNQYGLTPQQYQQMVAAHANDPVYAMSGGSSPAPTSAGNPTQASQQSQVSQVSQPFQFPNFNMPGFPYANLPQQVSSLFTPP